MINVQSDEAGFADPGRSNSNLRNEPVGQSKSGERNTERTTVRLKQRKERMMRLTLLATATAFLFMAGFAMSASAGTIADTDSDLVPDVLDNCAQTANGPAGPKNQVDTDTDGHGDVCDCDYLQDGDVLGDDISDLFTFFNTSDTLHDSTGDGDVLGDDISNCFGRFNLAVGDPIP
jgi:hypothetical protein